jgi:hypothetical protein
MRFKPIWMILSLTLLTLVLLSFTSSTPVQAQCTAPSSCKTCHVIQGQLPYDSSTAWHLDHSFADFCTSCHGGDRNALDADSAHAGMTLKLVDMGGNCKACHTSELTQCFTTYADTLGITNSDAINQALNSPPSHSNNFITGLKPEDISLPPSSSKPVATPTSQTGNTILAVILLVGLVPGALVFVWNNLRRKEPTATPAFLRWLWGNLRKPSWSPYTAGILLGLVCIFAVWLGNHTLSASGPIATLTSTLASAIAPAFVENNIYFKAVIPPGMDWGLMLLIGIFFGGMLGAISSGTFKIRWDTDPTWKKVFGASRLKRFVIGFFGAVILQYGASLAGGCTSGLAISGGMLLAPAAFIFMAGMFISGILTALVVYRRRF